MNLSYAQASRKMDELIAAGEHGEAASVLGAFIGTCIATQNESHAKRHEYQGEIKHKRLVERNVKNGRALKDKLLQAV
jgi:hypothetical protein